MKSQIWLIAYVFTAVGLLSGCGGGSGAASSNNEVSAGAASSSVAAAGESPNPNTVLLSDVAKSLGSSENYGPFNFYANMAAAAYNGKSELAPVSENTISPILHSLFFGMDYTRNINTDRLSKSIELPPNTWQVNSDEFVLGPEKLFHCTDGIGTMVVKNLYWTDQVDKALYPVIDAQENFQLRPLDRLIEFNQCQLPSSANTAILNGNIRVYTAHKSYSPDLDNDGLKTGRLIAYDNLHIEDNGVNYNVVGTEKWYGMDTCESVQNRSRFTLIENIDTSESLLFADMHSSYDTQQPPQGCFSHGFSETRFDGWLYTSNLGAVSISTDHQIQYILDNYSSSWIMDIAVNNNQPHANKGTVNFDGDNSAATFALNSVGQTISDVYKYELPGALASLTVEDSSGKNRTHLIKFRDFFYGVFEDMEDSDGDKIPNSWESYYGLNANDASDALIDSDGDRLSNLEEYNVAGTPTLSYDLGLRYDRSLSLRLGETTDSPHALAGYVYTSVETYLVSANLAQESWPTVELRLPSEAFWVGSTFPTACKAQPNDELVIQCSLGEHGNYDRLGAIHFASNTLTSITVSAEIVLEIDDIDLSNNAKSVTLE